MAKKYIDAEAAQADGWRIQRFTSTKESAFIETRDITSLPAADVVEVRHGHWIGFPDCLKFPNAYSDDHIVCSICEECFSILDNDTERFDFCPHCGAKMEDKNDV